MLIRMKYILECCLSCTEGLVETFQHFSNPSCQAAQSSSRTRMDNRIKANPAQQSVKDFIVLFPQREARMSPAFLLSFEMLLPRSSLSKSKSTKEQTCTAEMCEHVLLCWLAAYLARARAKTREQGWLVPMNIYLNFQSTVLPCPSRKQSGMIGKRNKCK